MSDLSVQILIEIRDELRSTKQALGDRIDQTNESLRETRVELRGEISQLRTELVTRMTESELRVATRTVEQTAATRDLYALLSGQLDLRDRVGHCEHDIAELKKRSGQA